MVATGNITSSANIAGGNLTITSSINTGTLNTTGNAVIAGNLFVLGNITYNNVEDLRIQDPVIILGTGPNGAPLTSPDSYDRGTFMEYYTSARGNAWMGWQNSSGNMIAAADVSFSGNDIIQVNAYGTFQAGNIYAQSAVSTGNITAGNLLTAGLVSATGNVSGGNLSAGSGIISTTGNINGGNLNATTGVRAATGYFTGNVDVLGNLNATVGLVYANSGIFYGNATTGLGAAYAGVPGYTPIGNTVIQMGANINNYAQLNFQNINNGTEASADYVLTADNGNDESNYIDLGIGSSTYSAAAFPSYGANDGYLLLNGGNLLINSANTGKVIKFIVGGVANSDIIGTMSATGLGITGIVSATGNITGGNVISNAQIVATGNITSSANVNGANINASAQVVATGNITGGNLNTAGQVVATGNITGGNLNATGLSLTGNVLSPLNVTGNITGGNLEITGTTNLGTGSTSFVKILGGATNPVIRAQGAADTGLIFSSAGTGNYIFNNGSSASLGTNTGLTVNSFGQNYIAIKGGGSLAPATIAAEGVDSNINIALTPAGTGNVTTGANIVATGNITGGNLVTPNLVSATTVTASGNITGANVNTSSLTLNASTINSNAATITVNSNSGDVDFAINGDTSANVFYVDAGTGTVSIGSSTQTTNAILAMNATNSFLMPVGNTSQRPGTGVTGMLRFNSTTNGVEVFNTTEWATVGTPSFTIISDEQFNGDGSTVAFTLSAATTTNSTIVSINGIVQIPTIAYSVGGVGNDVLTFTEAPETGDIIDVRILTTTTEVTAISNASGNAVVTTDANSDTVLITGNLNPISNVTYNLGSNTARWNELWLAGSTIVLGDIVIKDAGSNTIGFFRADGTTPATIDSDNVDTTQIASGTSNMAVIASGGNIRANVAGTTVQTISPGLVAITGDLSVTGNATLSGNILGDRVQNGTTSFDIQTPSGNANITVGATSNVAVFSTAGANIAGILDVTGNITGSNLIATTGLFTPGIVNSGSNGVGNIGSSTTYFNTVFAKATSAQYADLAENYSADAEYAPGTVLSFGGEKEVTASGVISDTRIAGVVSTNPSYIMNSTLESEYTATVALTGRVPTFVSGPISKGDMMVSAGNGRAIACATPAMGTVIGKALENHPDCNGVIEVVVGRL